MNNRGCKHDRGNFRIYCLINQDWALGYDRHQWILLRKKNDRSRAATAWRCRAFIGSNTCVLRRSMASLHIRPSAKFERVLDTLPARFQDWGPIKNQEPW